MAAFAKQRTHTEAGGGGGGGSNGHSECWRMVAAAMTVTVLMALVLGVFRIQILFELNFS